MIELRERVVNGGTNRSLLIEFIDIRGDDYELTLCGAVFLRLFSTIAEVTEEGALA